MTIRKIIHLPDPRLRQVTTPVTQFDDKLEALIDDMFETMYDANGVGLAATQIGLNLRLAVIDVKGDQARQYVLANPEIISSEGEEIMQEGCLSVPHVWDKVKRATRVTARAQNQAGEWYELTGEGVLAECIQHEIDHLNGKLFIDLLSPLKRQLAQRKLQKYKRNKE